MQTSVAKPTVNTNILKLTFFDVKRTNNYSKVERLSLSVSSVTCTNRSLCNQLSVLGVNWHSTAMVQGWKNHYFKKYIKNQIFLFKSDCFDLNHIFSLPMIS